jgi:hypothetical protein
MTNYHHKNAKPAPLYQPGDLVMLNGKNLKTGIVARQLDAKLQGPFNVIKVLSPTALKLELPLPWQRNDTILVFIIEPINIASNDIQIPPDLYTTLPRDMNWDMMWNDMNNRQDMTQRI